MKAERQWLPYSDQVKHYATQKEVSNLVFDQVKHFATYNEVSNLVFDQVKHYAT